MPPRPAFRAKQSRPISAIYLGKGAGSHALQPTSSSSSYTEGTPPELPDLPDPPSPSSSIGSVKTGLPSPPATNSTGSGSTGDPATITIRERPLSHHSNSSTSSGTASTAIKPNMNGSEVGVEDDDYDRENDNDNDHDSNDDTARLNGNVMALQRVKNLAERNRIVLSKLSRISSPSPHRPSPPRSGSETEREIEILSHSSSSSHHPSPSLSSLSLSHDSPRRHRTSASVSSSNSSHSRRQKRSSMASMSTMQLTDFEEEEDTNGLETATGTARNRTRDKTLSERDLITQSALAAVASSRRSPLNSRRRTALPKEFRSDLVDDSPGAAGPSTGRKSVADPQRESVDADVRQTPWNRPTDPVTPFRSTRPSTVRDYRRSGVPNPRWSVDDFRSPSTIRGGQHNTSHSNNDGNPKRERRQTLRGGSAESALLSPGGRSLIGEGLRAAGLSKKREEDRKVDLSPEDEERRSVLPERDRRNPTRAATSMANYRYMEKGDDPDPRYPDTDRPARQLPSRDRESSMAREASMTRRERERDQIPMDRAGSSFARYNHTASPIPLLATPQHLHERLSTASPFSARRLNAPTPGGASSANQTEHIKLMLESLIMLETQLNKVPLGKSVGGSSTGMGMGTGSSQTELTKNAQSMVYAAERLCGLLKQGNGKAVEEQVEAEVEGISASRDAEEIRNIWGRVAAEYRENSRVADELVRGMTGFLLGIGRVIRDIGPSSSLADCASGGSPSVHGKHASLDADEEGMRLRRDGVSPDVGSAGSGRRSASSTRERDRMALSSGFGSAGPGGQRPESVLARASPATYQKLRSGDRGKHFETPPPPSHKQQHSRQASFRRSLPAPGDRTESARKLFTPREEREQLLDAKFSSGCTVGNGMPTRDSQETVQPLRQSHEPSPTPASRTRGNTQERERVRMLPPLNIPKPLPTLPSEALVKRQTVNDIERIAAPTSTTPATTSRNRRSTIRSSLPVFPSLTAPSNATTAVTPHTVSNSNSYSNSHISAHTNSSGSGSASAFSLQRTNSSRSDRSQVTFSRPLESASVSVSAALTGLQMQFRSGAGESSADERDREGTRGGGKERERDKRRTIGSMRGARMSLDEVEQPTRDEEYASGTAGGAGAVGNTGSSSISGGGGSQNLWDSHAADRSAASTFLQQHPGSANGRERKRTVTDIWTD